MNLMQQNSPASDRQLNTLARGTKLNTKNLNINKMKATNLIQDMKLGLDIKDDLLLLGATNRLQK